MAHLMWYRKRNPNSRPPRSGCSSTSLYLFLSWLVRLRFTRSWINPSVMKTHLICLRESSCGYHLKWHFSNFPKLLFMPFTFAQISYFCTVMTCRGTRRPNIQDGRHVLLHLQSMLGLGITMLGAWCNRPNQKSKTKQVIQGMCVIPADPNSTIHRSELDLNTCIKRCKRS